MTSDFTARAHSLLTRSGLVAALAIILSACQTNIIDSAIESPVVSGIRNLPSTIMPAQFDSTAYVDSDFSIPNAELAADGQYAVIKAHFATNRNQRNTETAYNMFGDGRADTTVFGKSYVVLPRRGDTVDIEPLDLPRVQMGEDAPEPEPLAHNEILERDDFTRSIESDIDEGGNGSALIFVHDFNTSFETAAVRSAQLSYDIGFPGISYFFAWPSRGGVPSYIADVGSMQSSRANLKSMINEILYLTPTNNIYVVAKGLGARLAAEVLKDIFVTQPDSRNRIREIILVTPDIDSNTFRRDLAPFLGSNDKPLTVYTSAANDVLSAARSLSGARLVGDSSNGVFMAEHVETIDAGNADTSLAGHAGYLDRGAIVSDLWDLIRHGSRAGSRRQLRTVYSPEGTYWQYRD